MKTPSSNDLVKSLVDDLVPVKVVSPVRMLGLWLAIATLLGAGLGWILRPRYDFFEQLQGGPFLAASVLLIVAFATASWIAIRGAVPGRFGRGTGWAGWAGLTAFVAYAALYGVLVQGASSEYAGFSGFHTLRCCVLIATGTLVASGVMLAIVARLAPLNFAVAAIRAIFTAFLVGSIVGVVICPFDNFLHRLLGHFLLPVGIAALAYLPLERALQSLHRRQLRSRSAKLFR